MANIYVVLNGKNDILNDAKFVNIERCDCRLACVLSHNKLKIVRTAKFLSDFLDQVHSLSHLHSCTHYYIWGNGAEILM